jgi:hypothetical protein
VQYFTTGTYFGRVEIEGKIFRENLNRNNFHGPNCPWAAKSRKSTKVAQCRFTSQIIRDGISRRKCCKPRAQAFGADYSVIIFGFVNLPTFRSVAGLNLIWKNTKAQNNLVKIVDKKRFPIKIRLNQSYLINMIENQKYILNRRLAADTAKFANSALPPTPPREAEV